MVARDTARMERCPKRGARLTWRKRGKWVKLTKEAGKVGELDKDGGKIG